VENGAAYAHVTTRISRHAHSPRHGKWYVVLSPARQTIDEIQKLVKRRCNILSSG